jgi:glutamyl-Q tRNA(Asp) synthetase
MTGTGDTATEYRGRFAPSPTGPLHFGSLIAAVASYLQAKQHRGTWLVRIEDIDPTREQPEATAQILRALEIHGFEFDAPLYQSSRLDVYDAVIDDLLARDLAYPCSCSRKELRKHAAAGFVGHIYPGTCRNGANTAVRPAVSVRVRTDNTEIGFTDQLQGTQRCRPESEIGDFLIRRGDGLVAYQLAVVVDDAAQDITEIVRGTDLLEPTFMQIWLRQLLDYPEPAYFHFPVATDADGRKLSKQTGAPELDLSSPQANLYDALKFLEQNPDKSLKSMSLKDFWKHAITNWDPRRLPGARDREWAYDGAVNRT